MLAQLESFIKRRQVLAKKERQFVEEMNRALEGLGYRMVPATNGHHPKPGHQATQEGEEKKLSCPRCDRRFARPLHLGRHMAATHGRSRKK